MRFNRRFWPIALLLFLLLVGLLSKPLPAAADNGTARQQRPASSPVQAGSGELLRQADDAVARGNLEVARRAYELALKAGMPLQDDFARARNLGICYLNGHPPSFDDAAVWLMSALRLHPDDENTELLLGQALSWNRRFAEAASHYRKLASAHGDNADYAIALADALYGGGDTAGALSALESFLQRYPSNSTVRLQYAAFLGFSKEFAAAVGQYKQVLEFDPHNVVAEVGVAKVTSWQGHLDIALELYDNILQAHPGFYDALVGKAFSLMWMGRADEARTLFQAAARNNPADHDVAGALKSLGPAPAKAGTAAKVQPAAAIPEPPLAAAIETMAQSEITRVPAPVISVPPPDPAVLALQAADSAAARGDYATSVEQYRRALQLRPADRAARLRLAQTLSWAKRYSESATEYDTVLQADPADLGARLEKARVLSWGQQFDAALVEYAAVVRRLESQPSADPQISLSDVRLQYARVLGWARQFEPALQQLALLLPAGSNAEAKDRPILLEQAKVLSWARRYDDSIHAYDQALALESDFEARLGRAQVLYWSGHLQAALASLTALRQQQPRNAELNFLLAAVERGLGSDRRALSYLNYAPPDEETAKLRSSIRKQLRPVLALRTGLEDDREVDAAGAPSGIKVLRHSASFAFYARPDWPIEVSTTVAHALTSNALLRQFGDEGWTTESMLRSTVGVTQWMRLMVGAGGATSGGGISSSGELLRRYHFVYDVHPILTMGSFRLDFAATQHAADYTPLAIHDNVVVRRESIAPAYTWRKRLRLEAEYWRSDYSLESAPAPGVSFHTVANGGSVSATAILVRGERLIIEAGPRFEIFSFDDRAADIVRALSSPGFFTPRLYERIAAAGHVNWNPARRLHLDWTGTVGPQRIFGFASLAPTPAVFRNVGSLGAQIGFDVGRFTPLLRYDVFSSATAAFLGTPGVLGNGSYRSQAFTLGLTYHF